jgi:hypothetical protein
MATGRSPSKQHITAQRPLSDQDIEELRHELAHGKTPRVWFTTDVVRLPVGGSARVVHMDTPAEGDFIHAKPAGRPDDPWRGDTLAFGPEELSRTTPPTRPKPTKRGTSAPQTRNPVPRPAAAPNRSTTAKPGATTTRSSRSVRQRATTARAHKAVTPKADSRLGGASPKPRQNTSNPDTAQAGGKVEPAVVRAWARAQGMTISDRGRIPTEVNKAFTRAHRSSTARRSSGTQPATTAPRSSTPRPRTSSTTGDRHTHPATSGTERRRSAGPAKRGQRTTSPHKPSPGTKQDATIRAWARAHGIRIPDHGRIPAQIRTAYNQTH